MQMPMMTQSRPFHTTSGWNASTARKTVRKATEAKMSAPWAVLGMVAAFAGGTLLGMMGLKKGMAMSAEKSGYGWMMTKHHHHGFGQGACRHKHDESQLAAPGAVGDQSDRDEGE